MNKNPPHTIAAPYLYPYVFSASVVNSPPVCTKNVLTNRTLSDIIYTEIKQERQNSPFLYFIVGLSRRNYLRPYNRPTAIGRLFLHYPYN